MNSNQSNDMMAGRSANMPLVSPGSGMNDSLLMGMGNSNKKYNPQPDYKGNFNIGNLNQRSQQFQQFSNVSINH